MALPTEVFSARAVRQLEHDTMAAGVPGYTLMQRAGAAAWTALRQRWPMARAFVVVAGPGNNGGDGLVVARLARQYGFDVQVLLVAEPGALRGEAAQALQDLREAGMDVQGFDAARLASGDVVIDALLGIGVRAPLKSEWRAAIETMNASGRPVLSLDVPSGLEPDSGRPLPAVRAAATISFLGLKQGLFLGEGPEHAGVLLFDPLGLEGPAPCADRPTLQLLDHHCLGAALPPRARQSYKGMFGRVLIIGGGAGMPGAVRLAGSAALRVGAGLVTVASLPEHLSTVVSARPELMFHAVTGASDVLPALEQAEVIAIGPGLGRSPWARELLRVVLAQRHAGQHLVLDADALNLIAESDAASDDWILTPHPGEAARLLGITTQQVQEDRVAALDALCARRGGIIVLKGAASLVGRKGETPRLCEKGNPGMAVPGMGDVLTGAVAGILAQCGDAFAAAQAAVYAHAVAGDRCVRGGTRGVLALEVAQELRAVLAQLP